MKPSSAKQKGRKAQQKVRDAILSTFPQLEPDDVRSTSMGASGQDLLLSPAARKVFPYSVEVKQQESLNIWASLKQAEDNTKDGTTPLLVFGRNRTPQYVALSLDAFLKLVGPDNTNDA